MSMAKRSAPEKPIDPDYVSGTALEFTDLHSEFLARNLSGHLECIVGYRRTDQPWDLPYFHPSVGLREGGRKAAGQFIDLDRGTLRESSFLNPDSRYKLIKDRWITFPTGTSSYFGVIMAADRLEDA